MNVPAALAGLGLTAVALAVASGSQVPSFPAGQRCVDSVAVDGRPHCDLRDASQLAALCPVSRRPEASDAPRSGDAIDTAQYCQRRSVSRLDPQRGWSRMPAAELGALQVPIDVNSAPRQELTSLRGVGPVVADRIAQERPFASAEDLQRVRGIGPVTVRNNADRLRFSRP